MHLHKYFSGVYQSPRLDALHLHTLYIRVGRMNQYKEQWMEHATALIPKTIKIQDNQVTMTWDKSPVIKGIGLAAAIGLAALDGPLPVLDVIASALLFEYFS